MTDTGLDVWNGAPFVFQQAVHAHDVSHQSYIIVVSIEQ